MELLEKGHAFKDGFTTRSFSPLYGSVPSATMTKQLEEGHEHRYPRLRLILNVRGDRLRRGFRGPVSQLLLPNDKS
jgi:hypothetical protein